MKFDLVFEGGGAKGAAFVGALEVFLHEHTYGRLMGASAGSIVATLLAAGYDLDEMREGLNEQGADGKHIFDSFMGTPPTFSRAEINSSAIRAFFRNLDIPFIPEFIEKSVDNWLTTTLAQKPKYRHLFSLVERGGWYSAHNFTTWLAEKLDNRMVEGSVHNFSQMTLAEYFQATNVDLTLIAADSTDSRMLILNHKTAPDCPVVSAVRMSMSIPLIWPEIAWEAQWGRYRGRDITGHFVVDGGLISSFPLELFVSDAPHVLALMGRKDSGSVIGLLIDEKLPVKNAPPPPEKDEGVLGLDVNELKTVQRIRRLAETAIQAHDNVIIEAFEDHVVRLPAKNYGLTEFNMSTERREALVAAGQQAMDNFLQRNVLESFEGSFDFSIDSKTVEKADRMAGRLLQE